MSFLEDLKQALPQSAVRQAGARPLPFIQQLKQTTAEVRAANAELLAPAAGARSRKSGGRRHRAGAHADAVRHPRSASARPWRWRLPTLSETDA